jgi:hypothetical protein
VQEEGGVFLHNLRNDRRYDTGCCWFYVCFYENVGECYIVECQMNIKRMITYDIFLKGLDRKNRWFILR